MSNSENTAGQGNYEPLFEVAIQVQMIVFDFDGVFTDNRVLVLQDGTEGVFCSRADGLGLEEARKVGVKLLVLSKEKNPVVRSRCKKLNLPCIQGCDNKEVVLREEAEKAGISLSQIAYMGNDVNDLECLKIAGLPVSVADAYPSVKALSLYITKAKGGYGAVREFCDFIVNVKTGKFGIYD